MKVHKLAWPLVLMCCVVTGCEEKTEAEAPAAAPDAAAADGAAKPADGAAKAADANAVKPAEAPAAAKEPPMPPPAEACTALANAAKAKDEAKVLALSTPSTAGALSAEGAKEHLMSVLSAATCGAAKVEGDNATVAITSGEASEDVPFVKGTDGWKLDGPGYLSKYPPPDKAADKGKGAKGAKGKAAKPAKGKKHKK